MIYLKTAEAHLNIESQPGMSVNGVHGETYSFSEPTMIQCFIFYNNEIKEPFVLISADLIWFSSKMSREMRREIATLCETNYSKVALAATHSHGTQNPDPDFSYGGSCSDLSDFLKSAIREIVNKTLCRQPIQVSVEHSSILVPNISINRRKLAISFRPQIQFRVQSLFNARKFSDNRLDVVCFRNIKTGTVHGLLTRFTCHPVSDPENFKGSDYPGYFKRFVKSSFSEEPVVMFLQGFCGDVRPNFRRMPTSFKDHFLDWIIGYRFRKSRVGDSQNLAQKLANYALLAAHAGKDLTKPGCWDATSVEEPVILENSVSCGRVVDITTWNIAGLKLTFVSAEILSGFIPNKFLKSPHLFVGYTNGMIGYLAPWYEKRFGGYEIDGSRSYFGLTARISNDTCLRVSEHIIGASTIHETTRDK